MCLLRRGGIDKILLKEVLRAHIDISETDEKPGAFLVKKPIGNDVVDEFIDPHSFCSRRFRGRKDEVGHSSNGRVLVRV